MVGTHNERGHFIPDSHQREIRREKGKGKKSYTTGQSGGKKTIWRTEKDGRGQRMEAVKPVGGPANIKAEYQEEEHVQNV